ncbi:MAG: DUF5107 domain-containing protein [Clostridia bacterium]|nr:DUF5107 domain-containing protein [Clostridia bacterium]
MKATVKIEKLILPTYREPAMEEMPMFAENRVHQRTSGNPYPNKIVAEVDREERIDKEYVCVVLENEYIKVEILPEIGGRVYSALDKTTGYDFFYKQHVIKPALIGALGSWVSGGVEFNWPYHHRASGYMACDYSVEELPDGSVACHLSEHDPVDRMKGMVSIVLRPGELFFETRMRLYNRTAVPHSFLWWENAAVPVNEEYQIFFPQDVKYVNFHYLKSRTSFPVAGNGVYNGIPMKEARDISYHKNTREATSYFASASDYDFFGGYDHGKQCGVVHIGDHHISLGKKMFTWAYGQLSKSWERALTDTDGQYAELMAGSYSDNQPDFSWLAPYETKQFSQYWYPISKIGTPTFANLNAAFRIERGEDKNAFHLQVSKKYNGAVIEVRHADEIYLSATADLSPDTPQSFVLGEIPAYLEVRILSGEGEVIAEYEEKCFDEYNMPEVITDMPSAKGMNSAQELYLAGVHVDQYRDPAVKPDAYWKEALNRDINHIPSLIAMAGYEYGNFNFDLAKTYAERAVACVTKYNNHPISGEAYYVYAQILEALGEKKSAYDNYYKAAFCSDCVAKAMTRIAVLDLQKKDWKQAVRHAAWALDYGKNNALATAALSVAQKAMGNEQESEQILQNYLAADPMENLLRYLSNKDSFYGLLLSDPAQTSLDLAGDLIDMGLLREAKSLLESLTAKCPESAVKMVYYALAYLSHALSEESDALTLAQNAPVGKAYPIRLCELRMLEFAAEQGSDDAKVLLGDLLYHKRQYQGAAKLWESCSQTPVVKRNLAIAYFSHLGKEETALSLMKEALAEAPKDSELLYETVVLMNKSGAAPKEKIELLMSHTFNRDDLYTELAKSYNQNKEYEKAIETLMSHNFVPCEGGEHAIADQYMFAHFAMGMREWKAKNYTAALELFQKGQILPDSLGAGIWNHCKRIPYRFGEALCLEALGKKDEANKIYEYISETEIEYFSNMHLPELAFWRALSYDRRGMSLHSRQLITKYRRQWNEMFDVKDNGFFATTPFFMPFIEAPERLRRAKALYLSAFCDLYAQNTAVAQEKMAESYALNNDNLFAQFFSEK